MATNTWNPALYDTRHSFVTKYGEDLLELLQPRAGERILDVGCGTGHLTAKIAAAGASVLGMDSSGEMVATARETYPDREWIVGDISAIDPDELLKGGPFDAVFSNATLHWVSRAEEAVSIMSAVLKPGGRFVVEFGGHRNIERVLAGLLDAMEAVTGARPQHEWFYPTIGEYAPLLENYDIEVRSAWLFDRPTKLEGPEGLRNWYWMFRKPWMESLTDSQREAVLTQAEATLRPELHRDGNWWADYRRIRIVGVRA